MYIFLAEVVYSVLAETIHSVHFLAETIQNESVHFLAEAQNTHFLAETIQSVHFLAEGIQSAHVHLLAEVLRSVHGPYRACTS